MNHGDHHKVFLSMNRKKLVTFWISSYFMETMQQMKFNELLVAKTLRCKLMKQKDIQ